MKTILKYFTIVSLFLFISCETIVDVELPKHKPMIVVNSICNPDKPWELNVSLSKGILDDDKIEILNKAKIEILGNGNPVSTFNHYYNGTYKSQGAKPKVNIDYKLRVTSEKYGTVTSNCLIPEPVKIESVTTDTLLNKYGNKELELSITFTDTPNKKNFYSLNILRIENYNSKTYYNPESFSSNDLLFGSNENVIFEGPDKRFRGNEAFFDDSIIDGEKYKVKVSVELFGYRRDADKQKFEVVLNSLTKSYYQYHKSKKLQRETKDNPFAEPVIVYSNIKNGLGIFVGYSSSKYVVE